MSSPHDGESRLGVIEHLLRTQGAAPLNRRDALRLLGLAGLASVAGGCTSAYPTALGAPRPVRFSALTGSRVAIDVHTHIFNVRDVPAAEYALESITHLGEVDSGRNPSPQDVRMIRKLVFYLTRGLARMVPCARVEREMLLAMERRGENPLAPERLRPAGSDERQRARQSELCAWRLRIRTIINGLSKEDLDDLLERTGGGQEPRRAERMPRVPCSAYMPLDTDTDPGLCQPADEHTYVQFGKRPARILAQIERFLFGDPSRSTGVATFFGKGDVGPTINEWLRRMARPRYEIARELLETYGLSENGGGGVMDAFVVAMVDMEQWLDSSADLLEDQMLLTREIARLSGGRLLPFIAYDPLRDVIKEGSGLKLVKEAITNHGFVGVKLYPANGFRPIGNASLDEDFPRVQRGRGREDLGQALDSSLHDLYDWCSREGVPIMAHGNDTSGTFRRFADRGNPVFWGRVAERYPDLRINIGHFGGMDSLTGARRIVRRRFRIRPYMALEDAPENWSLQILQLMTNHRNVFSDVGAFGGVLEDTGELARFRRNLADLLGPKFYPAGRRQLMYASDWYMVTIEPEHRHYHERFGQLFTTHRYGEAGAELMGNNAVRFLGLRRGEPTRRRLDAFYLANGDVRPAWRGKVDALGTTPAAQS